MCQDSNQNESNNFLFGIIFGALIASLVAILIYKNQQAPVVKKLRAYLKDILAPYLSPSKNQKKTSSTKTSSKKTKESPPFKKNSPSPKKIIKSSAVTKDSQGKIIIKLPPSLNQNLPPAAPKPSPSKMFRKPKI